MSILFLESLNSPTLTFFEKVEDLFHPQKNKCFLPTNQGRETLTFNQTINVLNTFLCKHNTDQYEFFTKVFSDYTPTRQSHEQFCLMTEDIPAEKRWMLAFCVWDRIYEETVPIRRVFFYMPAVDQQSTVTNVYYLQYSHLNTNNTTKEGFTEKFNTTYEHWEQKILRYTSENPLIVYAWDSFPHTSTAFRTLINYVGGRIFCTIENESYSAQSLQNVLNDDNSTVFKIRYNQSNGAWRFDVVYPASSQNRQRLYTIHNYSTNPLDYLQYPLTLETEKDPVLVGVELELSTDYTMRQLVDAADELFFMGKTDTSISGSKNTLVELVTAPSSFKYLKRQYARWFNKLDYSKFDTTTSTNNGMHVHVGREHFDDNTHIRNFCWFFNDPANSEFLVYLSERGSYVNMSLYSPIYQFQTNYTRTKAFKDIYKIISRHRGITNFKGGWDSATTVEVRMFRGVVSYAAIVKNLEVVESLFYFTKSLTSYRSLNLKGYLEWLNKTPSNKYILLKKFIDQGNVSRMLIGAEVKNIIFNTHDPETIINLITKSGLKVTNEHITYLNKMKKKRTFILGENNTIKFTPANLSKLQPLDRDFAKRYLRDLPAA